MTNVSPWLSCSVRRFSDSVLNPMVAVGLRLVSLNRAKVAAPLSIWRRYLVYFGAVSGICFNGIKYGVESFLTQAWRSSARHGSRTRPLAKSRTIFSLVVRRCYGPESFRKGNGPGLDDRSVQCG
jgi:hypothetical protein